MSHAVKKVGIEIARVGLADDRYEVPDVAHITDFIFTGPKHLHHIKDCFTLRLSRQYKQISITALPRHKPCRRTKECNECYLILRIRLNFTDERLQDIDKARVFNNVKIDDRAHRNSCSLSRMQRLCPI